MVHYLYTSRRFDVFIIDIILQNVDKRPSANKPFGFFGGIAQLVERLHGMQEVSGSTPLTSTIFSNSSR